jgi:hypothetical protein
MHGETVEEIEKEENPEEIITGFCPSCIKKLAMDSIRGTIWELRY